MKLFVRRLRPARPRSRFRLRVSIPTIAAPLLGLLFLIQASPLNSPLSEREAPLALALRSPRRSAELVDASRPGAGVAATVIAGIGPSLLGTTESRLRAVGLLAGALDLALVVRLGESLYSSQVGVIAAILLAATPAGRSLLGAEFGVEPFLLLATLIALGAIRSLATSKASAVHAGLAGGVAIALVGTPALWIPVMAFCWLWRLHGLNRQSVAAVILSTTAGAAALVLLGAFLLGVDSLRDLADPLLAGPPTTLPTGAFAWGLWHLVPIAPLLALGLLRAPADWDDRGSPRFLGLWLLLSLSSALATGVRTPAYVAIIYALAVICSWGLRRASRRASLAALVATLLAAIALPRVTPFDDSGHETDLWAAREAGRFLRRVVDPERRIAAADEARGRLAYYGRRRIEALELGRLNASGVDYVVIDRLSIDGHDSEEDMAPIPREIEVAGRPLRVIAEFGPWVLARVSDIGRHARGGA